MTTRCNRCGKRNPPSHHEYAVGEVHNDCGGGVEEDKDYDRKRLEIAMAALPGLYHGVLDDAVIAERAVAMADLLLAKLEET